MYSIVSKHYPATPGCYLMKNRSGRVIYVGKAKNLRRRLSQYFQTTRQVGKIRSLVEEIQDIEVILVSTEVESLILENNLIKRYHPRYNVMLMADESGYGYVVKTAEPFPRMLPFRKNHLNPDLGKTEQVVVETRFGPYLSREIRDTLIKCITEACGIRKCNPMPQKVCFLYHLKRCSAPCEGLISPEGYTQAVERAEGFLSAPHLHLIGYLTAQMNAAAEAMEFERAAHIRDQINTLNSVFERQVVELDVKHDQDVVYLKDGRALLLHLKHGALSGIEWLPATEKSHSPEAFLLAHYTHNIPAEIIIGFLPDPTLAEAVLSETSGQQVKITVPGEGAAYDLLQIARLNYEYRITREELSLA